MEGEKAIRKRIEIDGENLYLIVWKTGAEATVPHENRPENLKLRIIVDKICSEITEIQGGMDE